MVLKKIYYKFLKLFYFYKIYRNTNEKIMVSIGWDKTKCMKNLISNNLDYFSEKISWHYHFFSGLNLDNKNILEIGTYDGSFTNFLAKIAKNHHITTIDLHENDPSFLNSYSREDTNYRNEFINKRNKNILMKNINFMELDSKYLTQKFKKNFFDYIWIDGNHLDPQVSLDIDSSFKILKPGGIMLCDDIIKSNYKDNYVSNDSYKKIKNFSQDLLQTSYILKRIRGQNFILKKYISISIKN